MDIPQVLMKGLELVSKAAIKTAADRRDDILRAAFGTEDGEEQLDSDAHVMWFRADRK